MKKLYAVAKITARVLADILDVLLDDERVPKDNKDVADDSNARVRPVEDMEFEYDLITTGQRIDLAMSNGDLDPKF